MRSGGPHDPVDAARLAPVRAASDLDQPLSPPSIAVVAGCPFAVQNDAVPAVAELVGREGELARLAELAADAETGHGALLLVSGEAGVGKTALVRAALAATGFATLEAASPETPGAPFRVVEAVLRSHLRRRPALLEDQPGLRSYLACILPELAPQARVDNPDAVCAAVAAAFAEIATEGPLAILIDDLQWSDEATLDVLRLMSEVVEGSRMLLIGLYRSDSIPRSHPIRRLRTDLRRSGRLREMALEPLDAENTGRLLSRVLGAPAGADEVAAVYARAEGLPFFIEELGSTLRDAGRDPALTLPESVRDAVLARVNGLPDATRQALGTAALIGQRFDLSLVASLDVGRGTLDELVDCGLVLDDGQGRCSFRHALVREAICSDLSWSRRRTLHRLLAEGLEAAGAAPSTIASHWLAAGDHERGRKALLAAAAAAEGVGAYRDAAVALSQALDIWPAGVDARVRARALERLGRAAGTYGDAVVAARAWDEAAVALRAGGDHRRLGMARRSLASALELQGAWDRALTVRQEAAEAFAAGGELGEAAAERLLVAARLRSSASFSGALSVLGVAGAEASASGRADLSVRIAALDGNLRCRCGDAEHGLPRVREALDLALSGGQVGAATEAYQRLADSLEHAGDYRGARETYVEATDFCQANGASTGADLCLACLTWVLRQLGEWDRAVEICRAVLASPTGTIHTQAVAHDVLGTIELYRGRANRARPHLVSASALARQIDLFAIEFDSCVALARLDALNGETEAAVARAASAMERWERTDCERHYSVPLLRWMATLGAELGSATLVQSCTSALARIAAGAGAEALGALAHALGETAMLERDHAGAAARFRQALALTGDLDLPMERAEIERRAAAALAPAGCPAEAIELLVSAYRTARRLGAVPLARAVAAQVSALGEKVERRLGQIAAVRAEHGGLSRRELEITRLVAAGNTSREIARSLSLSPRTVEMHVHNVLVKLDCRTRVDITRRASELGLLT